VQKFSKCGVKPTFCCRPLICTMWRVPQRGVSPERSNFARAASNLLCVLLCLQLKVLPVLFHSIGAGFVDRSVKALPQKV
jgi:hypothetical protein